jgi:hypothetical protein
MKRGIYKHYQFVKLCSALTKQGFNFQRDNKYDYGLIFDHFNFKRLFNPYTKMPFTNGICYDTNDFTKNKFIVQFDQLDGR